MFQRKGSLINSLQTVVEITPVTPRTFGGSDEGLMSQPLYPGMATREKCDDTQTSSRHRT